MSRFLVIWALILGLPGCRACESSASQQNMLGNLNICRQEMFALGSKAFTGSQGTYAGRIQSAQVSVHDEVLHTFYGIKSVPGKGLGLIASVDIPRGTRILIEKPLVAVAMPEMVPGKGFRISDMAADIQDRFETLTFEQQNVFLDLHNFWSPGEENLSRLLTIFRSNAYNTGESHVGLFPKIARINHSCKPNCGNFWSENANHRVIYTFSDIKKDEEITVSYIPLLKSIADRQARLQQYGFVCDCPACQSTHSSKQRVKIFDLLTSLEQKLHFPSEKDTTNERLIKKATSLVDMIQEEGLTDYLARAFHLAAVFNQRRGNLKLADLTLPQHLL